MMRNDRAGARAAVASLALPRTGDSLPAAASAKLDAYLDLLAKWNRVHNLTAIRERDRMGSHHVNDALAVLPFLPDRVGLRVLDVGSGGGIPGIPLAIARPEWRVALLDANRKKATFLTHAAIELELSNVRVIASRVEDFAPDARFDVVISRAFSDLRSFAQVASRLASEQGIIAAMKGVLPRDEIDALPRNFVVTATPALDVPGLEAQRHLVLMRVASDASVGR